jgi:hypothetical protein
MSNRTRSGIIVILVCLLFDAFIVEHQKTIYANCVISCYPAGNIYPTKDTGGKKHDAVYHTINSIKEK